MYGRGNNNVGSGGDRTGFSTEPPVDSVPRARSDIVDYHSQHNNSSDYNYSDNQGLSQQQQQQYYHHPDQQYQQVRNFVTFFLSKLILLMSYSCGTYLW